jgi:hypothetical protein
MKLNFLPSLLLLYSINAPCQALFSSKDYPKGYFRDPLGIPMHLAANFGELRANHFHMGLDIRTEKKENLLVYAAAAGYVTRVKIEPFGFGNAIYLRHPNGYTTLYAHLNRFFPALQAYVEKEQYRRESWQTDMEIPAGLFPVAKGSVIAWSGNTGGSEGPHLHFEIRNAKDDINLNPLLFGLPVPDQVPPVIRQLALYDGETSIYEQAPRMVTVHKKGTRYGVDTDPLILSSPHLRLAINAFDSQSGSRNPNGIYEALLLVDGKQRLGFQMDRISYENTRNVNAHIDYKTRATGGPWLQQLFVLPGLFHSIYRPEGDNGSISLVDERVHEVQIIVKDAAGNSSRLLFHAQFSPDPANARKVGGKMFYPQMLDGVETGDMSFYLGEKCLYDSVHLSFNASDSVLPEAISRSFSIGAHYIPLADSILVRIRPILPVESAKMGKVVMQWSWEDQHEVQPVSWQGGWASAKFREFGNFQLLLDDEPPVIEPLKPLEGVSLGPTSRIAFLVRDNLGSIRNFRAELDGKWLCFSHDKGRAFIYKMDDHCAAGPHRLTVSAEDEAGNRATRSFSFSRQ